MKVADPMAYTGGIYTSKNSVKIMNNDGVPSNVGSLRQLRNVFGVKKKTCYSTLYVSYHASDHCCDFFFFVGQKN